MRWGAQFERNYRAFNIGRKIVLRPDLFGVNLPKHVETVEQAIERKANILNVSSSICGEKGNAAEYRKLCKESLEKMAGVGGFGEAGFCDSACLMRCSGAALKYAAGICGAGGEDVWAGHGGAETSR